MGIAFAIAVRKIVGHACMGLHAISVTSSTVIGPYVVEKEQDETDKMCQKILGWETSLVV
jgi:hypothetical protein